MAKKEIETTQEVEVVKESVKPTGKMVAIPLDPLNKKETEVKVTINGNSTVIKRGVQQVVSNEVYEMLVISGHVVEG